MLIGFSLKLKLIIIKGLINQSLRTFLLELTGFVNNGITAEAFELQEENPDCQIGYWTIIFFTKDFFSVLILTK